MIYDEGFDILVKDYSFFAFSKYVPNTNLHSIFLKDDKKKTNWSSMCYSTLIGWYHKGDYWGCFYAEKQNVNPRKITNDEVTNKLLVVEGTVKSVLDTEKLIRFKQGEQDEDYYEDNEDYYEDNEISFLQGEFKNHDKTVEKLNSAQKMWEATNYKVFSDMSIKELNRFAGRKKHSSHSHGNNFKKLRKNNKYIGKNLYFNEWIGQKDNNTKKLRKLNLSPEKAENDFPENFLKWVPFMSEPRNQGHCGSCYAVATLNMLEARLRIKHEINEKLSLNHILKCSVYNQGCDGGYSYLVMKFANELEMIPEKCENNSDDGGEYNCNKLCNEVKDQKRIYKVKDYKYLGGSYGKCSEELLMKELMENGPIVVSFEPEYHFMLYKKGIYKSLNEKNWITKKLDKPEWEKVDHSVTLVGWGYDEVLKEKYWLLLNSWGKHWGENGYFKMVRGIDHMGIESICEVGTIYYDDI